MPKKACSTCRHYQTEGFDVLKGWCHWFDAYPGMHPELPSWVRNLHPYPVWPCDGRRCPQWQEALP